MSEKRFIYGRAIPINSNDSLPCITDQEDGKDYVKFTDIVDLLNQLNDENKFLKKQRDYWKQELKQERQRNRLQKVKQ